MRALVFVLVCLPCSVSWLQAQEAAEPSVDVGDPLPRSLTPEERESLLVSPLTAADVVTPPPSGPITCVAEYEPMAGIVVGWQGSTAWKNILAEMGANITTVGAADYYVAVPNASVEAAATNSLQSFGANMSRVKFSTVGLNSIWMRDYGPRYIYHGGVRAIIDHTYNRPRPADNAFNGAFSQFTGHSRYELPLVHGGGNYHLDALGRSRTTRLINNENPSLTEQQIFDIWAEYQSVATTFYQPLPASVDATQHIDMWMQVIGDNEVIISEWPFNAGSTQAQICDAAASGMAAEGYTVHRIPARSVGGTHYTYTNVVMCNDLVLVPRYSNAQVTQHNNPALQVWQAALPSKTIVQIDCQAIVTSAGVMHCIVMHMPAFSGGTSPLVYQFSPAGGEILQPGSNFEVRWNSDDDVGTETVDLLLSMDGGSTFPSTIVAGIPDNGFYIWSVPDVCTGHAVVRVVARDAQSLTGFDDTDVAFAINGSGCSASTISYGSGSPGQNGVPTLTSGLPVIGATFDLDIGNAWPSSPCVFLVGAAQSSTPFAGGTVLVQAALSVGAASSAGGAATLSLAVPADIGLAGGSLYWQGWVGGDPGGMFGLASTMGVETRLGF